MIRESNLSGGKIFRTHPDQPVTHPASYTVGTGSFLGLKRPRRGANHPPTSSAMVKKRVELYLMSCSRVNFTFTVGYSDIWNYHDVCTTPNKISVSLKKIWSWGSDLSNLPFLMKASNDITQASYQIQINKTYISTI
jgi:hypothetical protein